MMSKCLTISKLHFLRISGGFWLCCTSVVNWKTHTSGVVDHSLCCFVGAERFNILFFVVLPLGVSVEIVYCWSCCLLP